MKKYIILFLSTVILLSIILFTYYVTNNSNKKTEEKVQKSKKNTKIEDTTKNKTFIDNQIMIYLNKGSSINTAEKIANEIHATVLPDYIPEFQSYVLEFSSKTFETEEEVLTYCDSLKMIYSEIELCTFNGLSYID